MIAHPQTVPLSVGQEAMWLDWRLDPEQWIHIIPTPYAVAGEVDVTRLRAAVHALGRAYPQLRGRVVSGEGGPVLSWADAPEIPLTEHETSFDRDAAVRLVWQRPFDLRRGPLARVDLVRGRGWTVLVIAVHHIVHDGASALLTIDALARAYAGEPLEQGDDGPALTGFALRSRDLADTGAGAAHRDHWRGVLGGRPPFTLPAPVGEPAYTALRADVPEELAAELRSRAATSGVSYVTVLLTAYCAVLRRHTGADDVLVFLPFHGRTAESVRDTVGYFVNTLPVSVTIAATDTYADLFQQVRTRVRAAVDNGDLPLPAILRSAGLTGPEALARTAQTVFQHWNAGLHDTVDVQDVRLRAEGSSARLSLLDMESSAGFPLAVMVREDSAGTHVLWKDPNGAVGAERIAVMAADYLHVLREIAADPDAALVAVSDDARRGREAPEGRPAPNPVASGAWDDMVQVWEEVLGIDDVTPEDSFFELGGHSLLAESLVNAVSRRFATDVSIRTLFDHPFLAEFADEVLGTAVAEVPPDRREGPASVFQQGIWLAEQLEPGLALHNVPMAWRVPGGGLDPLTLRRALAGVIADHEVLRTSFHNREGRILQVVEAAWEPEPLTVRVDGEDAVHEWLDAAAHHEFDLESGRPLTAALVESGGDQVFFVCVHHLVWDAASQDVFLRALNAHYTGLSASSPALEAPVLPAWLPGASDASPAEGSSPFLLPDGVGLHALTRKLGCTAADVALAAFAALLAWYTGKQELTVEVDDSVLGIGAAADRTFTELVADVASRRRGTAVVGDARFSYGTPGTPLGRSGLHLAVSPAQEGHDGRLVFDGRLGLSRMRLMADHYTRIFAILTDEPDTVIGAVEPLSADERETQLRRWNDTAAAYPRTAVTELIREHAVANPFAVALTDGDVNLTYGALLATAEERARDLVHRGVQPGELVALLLPRGQEQVTAILAVLLAGAAYLPLDPAYPPRRIAHLLADSGSRWVLTDGDGLRHGGLREFTGQVLDRIGEGGDRTEVALPTVFLDSPAYCIYTSGTTGRPKGVVITHRNLVRLLRPEGAPLSFSSSDVWTAFHSYTFDVSVWEVFGCLSHGGRLVTVSTDEVNDPWLFLELLRGEGVTVVCQTPSAFGRLTSSGGSAPGDLDGLRYVLLAGEALRPAGLRDWAERFPHVRLVNLYGPTETTVYASSHTITPADIATGTSTIGTPLPTTTLFVLDQHTGARFLPVGAVGELYIGGEGVAAGYLNRAESTAEKFVPSPFDGRVLFRTGDLVRHATDGGLEFLGRADRQVKVRGYRVEPGEVETALRAVPGVADAVVVVEDDHLVAVVRGARDLTSDALRAHLAEELPAYLVPHKLKRVDSMPLTSHGKLDLDLLMATAVPLAVSDRPRPETSTEIRLARLWTTVLGVDDPGVDDEFFALGGHSLLAFRLVGLVGEHFGVRLGVRDLYERSRLRELARLLDERGDASDAPAPSTAVDGATEPVSPFHEGVLLAELLSESVRHNVFLAWTTPDPVDLDLLEAAFTGLVAGHEILRTGYLLDAGTPRQSIHAPWTPKIETLDLRTSRDAPAELTGWLDDAAGTRFQLATGQLLRVALADLGERGHALLLCLHHVLVDDSAIPVLLAELQRYFQAARDGRPAAPPVQQYGDFVRVHQARLDSGRRRADLAHWRGRLSSAPPYLDFPAPRVAAPDGAVRLSLPPSTTRRLREFQSEQNVSWFMAFGGALCLALHRWSGQADLTVGVPVTSRAPGDGHDLLGPALNTVVLRSNLGGGNATAADVVRMIRAELLTAMEHAGTPFEDVVRDLAPERRAGRTPYVDVLLNMNLRGGRRAVLGDAVLEPFFADELWARDTKFGATLTVAEQDDDLTAILSYQGALVSAEAARDLANGVVTALAELVDGEDGVTAAPRQASGRAQYLDLAIARESDRDSTRYRDQVEHWASALSGAPAYLDLRAPARVEPNGVVPIPLPDGLSSSYGALQAEHRVSPYMIVCTALAVLLHRRTGRRDVTFTSGMTSRVSADLADVIGPALNTVVLRSRLDPADTVLHGLLTMRETVLDAMANAEVGFADVVTRLRPPRLPGRTPWGDVALEFEVVAERPPTLGGHPLHPVDISRRDAEYLGKTSLTVAFVLEGSRLRGRVAHRGDRVGRADAERFAAELGRLVASVPDLVREAVAPAVTLRDPT
ncbi:amino acid adenylation domain-containing protein [Umezawaea sp. NPDC059074]|uniref:amino acid adenylation domain-containing protein n=1 Tax=Umezawaea sp. NPDC059074 TaxID=3346716 RepID=UPI0036BC2AA4